MPTALITGVAGQDGAYLSRFLLERGYRVIGLVQPETVVPPELTPFLRGVEMVTGDLRDARRMRTAVDVSEPDEVYNLAGISSVAKSWQDPELTADVNALGVLRLLEALVDHVARSGRRPRLLQASSAEMFGSPDTSPQNEDTPLRPRNPYAVSKAFAHSMVATYRQAHELFASTVILYNHESSLRPRQFVTRKITSTVAAIARGEAEYLILGDLTVERDWGHASDYVRAMWLALQHGEPNDFVVATGVPHTVLDFVEVAFASAGISNWRPLVRSDRSLVRPTDATRLVGDASRARALLGWTPEIDFPRLVTGMVQDDLAS